MRFVRGAGVIRNGTTGTALPGDRAKAVPDVAIVRSINNCSILGHSKGAIFVWHGT